MKRFTSFAVCVLLMAVVLAASGSAQAAITGLIDTTTAPEWNSTDNNGSQYDYLIDRSQALWLPQGGQPLVLFGSVDDLSFGSTSSYLEIGLVSKNRADDSLDTYNWAPYMFNQSAFMLVNRNSNGDVLVRASDYNGGSGAAFNLGAVDAFNYTITLTPNADTWGGDLLVEVNGASSSFTYGIDNWEIEWYRWYGYDYPSAWEFQYGAYLIAQAFTENLNTTPTGQVVANVSLAAVPEPATLAIWSLLGLTAVGFGLWRRRRAA